MPPRANRRTTRFTSREPEQPPAQESSNPLVRPHLPALQGTPSTRRQYTYGSAAEPPPKVGAGLQRMDLGSAVNQALANNFDDEDDFVRAARPRPAPAKADDEASSRDNTSGPATNAVQQLATGRDDDSSRSFGLESDYYEDATIGSVPPLITGAERRPSASNHNPRAHRGTSIQRSPQQSRLREQLNPVEQPSRFRDTQQTTLSTARQARQQPREVDEEEPERGTAPATRSRTTANTPAPSRTRQSQIRRPKPAVVEVSSEGDDSEDESSSEGDIENKRQAARNARKEPKAGQSSTRTAINPLRQPSSQGQPQDAVPKRRGQGGRAQQGLFASADRFDSESSPFTRARQIPDDPQERDRAIQQQIQDAEDQAARERAEREQATPIRRLQQWCLQQIAWLSTVWPFNAIWPRRGNDDFDDFDDDQYNNGGPTDWWRLLNPMTYVEALIWLVDNIMDRFVNLVDGLSGIQVRGSWVETAVWSVLIGGISILIGVFMVSALGTLQPSLPSGPNFGSGGIRLPSPAGLFHGVGDRMPSFSMPSWSPWSRGEDEEDPFAEIDLTDDLKRKLKKIKAIVNDQKVSLKNLEAQLPHFIRMEMVNGKPSIPQEFWHALQDFLKESGGFLNMEKKRNGNYEISTEKQWKAIVSRLNSDKEFASKLGKDVESGIKDKLPVFWDTWFKNNNKVLDPLIEKAMAKTKSAGSRAGFDKKIADLINEQLGKQNQTAVPRSEFIKHIADEMASHKTAIQAELKDLKSEMMDHIKESIRTAQLMAPKGTSDAEMRKLIREIVLQTISDGSLGAAAKTKIHEDWNKRLKHQINFFAVGAGATIDHTLSTNVWNPWNKDVATEEASRLGLRGSNPLPPIAALLPWQDQGDCFCSDHAIDDTGRYHGARISVQLGYMVVPTDVVIEHINQNATTDPTARPRHIEIFARFEDNKEREEVFAVTDHWFREDIPGRNVSVPLSDQFVKISDFEYVGNELNDGVHVQHINDRFSNLGIGTDQIVIRAMSNYGAVDHTCFYRVRLFGNVVEEEIQKPTDR
ncbi:spindle pole body-associated sad1 [Fusarium beomiforme]|uniref:Spindle pole body-associated sad1 n=1 Tax=Fusarium beomiforme TaxID=44412 RepID=A0A9P5AJX5_9HYPO|nr:spindle pole body-associated sad1 [Fusarium beomiforme]